MARFRQDGLTEKERFEALLHRQSVDRVPFYMWEFSFAAITVGYPKVTTFADPVKSFDAFCRTHEMFDGWHYIYYTPGAIGVREFGGEAKLPTGEYAQAATPLKHIVQSEEDVWSLKLPEVRTAGAIPLMMEFAKLEDRHGFPITFSSGSILKVVQNLTGAETMCRWMIRKPKVLHRLCRLVADFHIAIAQYWVDTFDRPERIIPLTAAPTESNQMISPKHFREFSLPYQKEVYEKLLGMGVKHINTHICGEQNLNLPYWAELPLGNPGIISVGHEVDLEKASKIFPNHILVGNVAPAVIQTGTPEQVYERCRSCIEKGKKHPGGFALAPGCELPPMAPPYNVWMMRKAINDFGWYE